MSKNDAQNEDDALTAHEWSELIERAQKGEKSTLPRIRALLQDPSAIEILGGDLAKQTELTLIKAAGGNNLAFKESLSRKLEVMRVDLAGANPSPLERLLVDRIVLCWLILHDVEIRVAQFSNLTIDQGDHWQRKIDHAHRRYLAAIKVLATIRKLALPVLQVNIAKRQTNIAAGTAIVPPLDTGPNTPTRVLVSK